MAAKKKYRIEIDLAKDEKPIQAQAISQIFNDEEFYHMHTISRDHFIFAAQTIYHNIDQCHHYVNASVSSKKNKPSENKTYVSSFSYLVDIIKKKINSIWNFLIPWYLKIFCEGIKVDNKVPTPSEALLLFASQKPNNKKKSTVFAAAIDMINQLRTLHQITPLQSVAVIILINTFKDIKKILKECITAASNKLKKKKKKKKILSAINQTNKDLNLIYLLLSMLNVLLINGGDPELKSKKQRFQKSLKYLKHINHAYCSPAQKIVVSLLMCTLKIYSHKTPIIPDAILAGRIPVVCITYIHNIKLIKYNTIYIQILHFFRSYPECVREVTKHMVIWLNLYFVYKRLTDITELITVIHTLRHQHYRNPELEIFDQIHAQLITKEYDYTENTGYSKNNQVISIRKLSTKKWHNIMNHMKIKTKKEITVCDVKVTFQLFGEIVTDDELGPMDNETIYLAYELYDKKQQKRVSVGYPAMITSKPITYDDKNNDKVTEINKMTTSQKCQLIMKLIEKYPHIALKCAEDTFPNLLLLYYDTVNCNKSTNNINVKWQECLKTLLEMKKRKKDTKCYDKNCNKKAIRIDSGCWHAWYCSKHCQKLHWKHEHKSKCLKQQQFNKVNLQTIIDDKQLKQLYKTNYNI